MRGQPIPAPQILTSNDQPKSEEPMSSIMLISRGGCQTKSRKAALCERPFAASYQAFTACCPRLSVALGYLQASARSGPHTSATPKQSQEKIEVLLSLGLKTIGPI